MDLTRVDEIKVGDPDFWMLPHRERDLAFATLRRERPISFHEEPEVPMLGKGPGFWALVRHADVLEVSRHAETFSSARWQRLQMPDGSAVGNGQRVQARTPRARRRGRD